MTVEEKAYNYASKLVKNRLTASEVAAHYGRGYIEGQEDMKQLGWHPVSELPPEEGKYIAIDNGMPDVFRVDYLEPFGWCVEVMGAHEVVNVKWWCYPPEKE